MQQANWRSLRVRTSTGVEADSAVARGEGQRRIGTTGVVASHKEPDDAGSNLQNKTTRELELEIPDSEAALSEEETPDRRQEDVERVAAMARDMPQLDVSPLGTNSPRKTVGKKLESIGDMTADTFQRITTGVVGVVKSPVVLMAKVGGLASPRVASITSPTPSPRPPPSPKPPLEERVLQLEIQMKKLQEKGNSRTVVTELNLSPRSQPDVPQEEKLRTARSLLQEMESEGTLVKRLQTLEDCVTERIGSIERSLSSIQSQLAHVDFSNFTAEGLAVYQHHERLSGEEYEQESDNLEARETLERKSLEEEEEGEAGVPADGTSSTPREILVKETSPITGPAAPAQELDAGKSDNSFASLELRVASASVESKEALAKEPMEAAERAESVPRDDDELHVAFVMEPSSAAAGAKFLESALADPAAEKSGVAPPPSEPRSASVPEEPQETLAEELSSAAAPSVDHEEPAQEDAAAEKSSTTIATTESPSSPSPLEEEPQEDAVKEPLAAASSAEPAQQEPATIQERPGGDSDMTLAAVSEPQVEFKFVEKLSSAALPSANHEEPAQEDAAADKSSTTIAAAESPSPFPLEDSTQEDGARESMAAGADAKFSQPTQERDSGNNAFASLEAQPPFRLEEPREALVKEPSLTSATLEPSAAAPSANHEEPAQEDAAADKSGTTIAVAESPSAPSPLEELTQEDGVKEFMAAGANAKFSQPTQERDSGNNAFASLEAQPASSFEEPREALVKEPSLTSATLEPTQVPVEHIKSTEEAFPRSESNLAVHADSDKLKPESLAAAPDTAERQESGESGDEFYDADQGSGDLEPLASPVQQKGFEESGVGPDAPGEATGVHPVAQKLLVTEPSVPAPSAEPAQGLDQGPTQEPEHVPAQELEQGPAKSAEPAQGLVQGPAQEPEQAPEQVPAQEPEHVPAQELEQGPAKSAEPAQGLLQGLVQGLFKGLGQGPAQVPEQAPEQETAQEPEQELAQGREQESAQAPEQGPEQGPAPSAEPAQGPAQEPEQAPEQVPAPVPAQEPEQAPEQVPAQEPEQVPAPVPAQEPEQAPEQVPAQEPEHGPAPSAEPAQGLLQGLVQGLFKGLGQGPAQETAQEPEQELAQGREQEPPQAPAQAPEQETAQEPEQELAQGREQEPAQAPEQVPTQAPEQGPAQEPAQEPEQGLAPSAEPPQGLLQGLVRGLFKGLGQGPAQAPEQETAQEPEQELALGREQEIPQAPAQASEQGPAQEDPAGKSGMALASAEPQVASKFAEPQESLAEEPSAAAPRPKFEEPVYQENAPALESGTTGLLAARQSPLTSTEEETPSSEAVGTLEQKSSDHEVGVAADAPCEATGTSSTLPEALGTEPLTAAPTTEPQGHDDAGRSDTVSVLEPQVASTMEKSKEALMKEPMGAAPSSEPARGGDDGQSGTVLASSVGQLQEPQEPVAAAELEEPAGMSGVALAASESQLASKSVELELQKPLAEEELLAATAMEADRKSTEDLVKIPAKHIESIEEALPRRQSDLNPEAAQDIAERQKSLPGGVFHDADQRSGDSEPLELLGQKKSAAEAGLGTDGLPDEATREALVKETLAAASTTEPVQQPVKGHDAGKSDDVSVPWGPQLASTWEEPKEELEKERLAAAAVASKLSEPLEVEDAGKGGGTMLAATEDSPLTPFVEEPQKLLVEEKPLAAATPATPSARLSEPTEEDHVRKRSYARSTSEPQFVYHPEESRRAPSTEPSAAAPGAKFEEHAPEHLKPEAAFSYVQEPQPSRHKEKKKKDKKDKNHRRHEATAEERDERYSSMGSSMGLEESMERRNSLRREEKDRKHPSLRAEEKHHKQPFKHLREKIRHAFGGHKDS